MSKIRINDLAKQLEVKSNEILALLPQIGISKKMTHSNSLEDDEVEKVKKLLDIHDMPAASKSAAAKPKETIAPPKIDFSKLTKPGELARTLRMASEPAMPANPAVAAAPPPAIAVKPVVRPV